MIIFYDTNNLYNKNEQNHQLSGFKPFPNNLVSDGIDLLWKNSIKLSPIRYGNSTFAETGHGKPFLMLAGEMGNNIATSLEYLKWVWPKLVDTKLKSKILRYCLC